MKRLFLAVVLIFCVNISAFGFPIPDTGQTICYDDQDEIPCPSPGEAYYGQDANYSINPMSYTKLDVNGNDLPDSAIEWVMVRDNVTGLIWEVKQANDGEADYSNPNDADNEYTWYDSDLGTYNSTTDGYGTDTEDYINLLNSNNFGGYSDWRLPTPKELKFLVDSGTYMPAINTDYFLNTKSERYWSSSTCASYITSLWFTNDTACYINYFYGSVGCMDRSYSCHVRAVRSGHSWLLDNLIINNESTVLDSNTSLMWQQSTSEENMTWKEALNYCENLNLAGYNDWRLPTDKELMSIIDYSIDEPEINTNYFPTIKGSCWSASTSTLNTDLAWCVSTNGYVDYYDKSDTYYVRAVRLGQVSGPWDNLIISFDASVRSDISPLSTLFSANIEGGTAPYTYFWDFGDGTTSDLESPLHNYSTAGYYNVVLTVTDSSGIQQIANSLLSIYNILISVYDIIDMRIFPDTIKLTQLGDTVQPLVQVLYSEGGWETQENKELTWASSDESVVSVESGLIVAKEEGQSVITATKDGVSAQIDVTVIFDPVSIDVSQTLVFLTAGDTYTPTVTANYADGTRGPITDFTVSYSNEADNIVSIQDNQITAIGDGIAHLEIKRENLAISLHINVSQPVPLNITPGIAKAKPGDIIEICVDGGTLPYQVSEGYIAYQLSQEGYLIGNKWEIEVPNKTGEKEYVVIDDVGAKLIFKLMIQEALSFGNISTISQTGDLPKILELQPKAGTPPYTWYASEGSFSLKGSEDQGSDSIETTDATQIVQYTSPNVTGIHTITLNDSSGQSVYHLVSTVLGLQVSPAKLFVESGQTQKLTIFGGVAPYTVVCQEGEITPEDDSTFIYRAPHIFDNYIYIITIKDSEERLKDVIVQVARPLCISPEIAYVDCNETKKFSLTGGFGKNSEIFIQALKGDLSVHPDSNYQFEYTAPDFTGHDTIIVTDLNGYQIKAKIEITSDFFFITPSQTTLLCEEEILFKAVGGTQGDLIWTVEGEGNLDSNKERTATYKAPSSVTTDLLKVSDIQSKQASASINVITDYVVITPKIVYLKPGQSMIFRALQGTEQGYEFTFTNGSKQNVEDHPEQIIYKAPNQVGEYFVNVFDSAGNTDKAKVVVSGGIAKERLSKVVTHTFSNPSKWPDSDNQPLAVGDVQKGGTDLILSADFPNYVDDNQTPVSMNYYVAVYIEQSNSWLFWAEDGNVYDINNVTPFKTNSIDMIYKKIFEIQLCNPDSLIPLDRYCVYGLAVESVYDPYQNLTLEPADAPFELWAFYFDFQGCD